MKKGLTLIELLVVISVLGALSAIGIRVLNSDAIRNVATDGARRANISTAANGIEAFYAVERFYPNDSQDSNNPLEGPNGAELVTYLSVWPGPDYVYLDDGNSDTPPRPQGFMIFIESADLDNTILKYSSEWQSVQECADTSDSRTTLIGC